MAADTATAADAAALIVRGALPAEVCARWLATVATVADGRSRALPALSPLQPAAVLRAVAGSALRGPIEHALGPSPVCSLSQSWLRHGRPPHQWHQDGGLHFDFIAHAGQPLPDDALLELRTCWIALTPCGDDAPGLEWVDVRLDGLLPPAALTDDAVRSRFATRPRVRPVLQAGDALLFDGGLLHRTHLTSTMPHERSSLELRFFRAGPWPARVGGEHCVAWA